MRPAPLHDERHSKRGPADASVTHRLATSSSVDEEGDTPIRLAEKRARP